MNGTSERKTVSPSWEYEYRPAETESGRSGEGHFAGRGRPEMGATVRDASLTLSSSSGLLTEEEMLRAQGRSDSARL